MFVLYAVAIPANIASVGKQRGPVTPAFAATVTVMQITALLGLVYVYGQL